MGKVELHPSALADRIIRLEARLDLLQERSDAQQLVLSWLLARQSGEEAIRFLSTQANEMEGNRKFLEHVALFDELVEDVRRWHAQWPSAPDIPR